MTPNVKVERRAAALPQSKLLYPQPSIPSDAQRSYAACPLQRKLERTVDPCAYLKKDLPIAINRGVAIKTAAVIPAVASPEVSFTLLLSRNGIYTHCPVRLELAVKTMARRAPPTKDIQTAGGNVSATVTAAKPAPIGQIAEIAAPRRLMFMRSNAKVERRAAARPLAFYSRRVRSNAC